MGTDTCNQNCNTYRCQYWYLYVPCVGPGLGLVPGPSLSNRCYLLHQENAPCKHPAVHGLHYQASTGHRNPVVRRFQPLPPPAHHRDQVRDDQTDRHRPADCTGHGVSLTNSSTGCISRLVRAPSSCTYPAVPVSPYLCTHK